MPYCHVDLLTEMAAERLPSGEGVQHGDTDTDMSHISGGMEQDGMRFHHSAQNHTRFKTYCLFLGFSI